MRGTYRANRHAPKPPVEPTAVSEADRRRTLKGLSSGARRMASDLLEQFSGWDASSLTTLRSYVLAVERLQAFEDARNLREIRAESRIVDALRKALQLEAER
jgi:hypothetical protein